MLNGAHWHDYCILISMYVTSGRLEIAMDSGIDAMQTERVLSHLARLKHQGDETQMDVMESLRPAWLGVDAWDIILEDLEAQHYRNRARAVLLRVVAG